MGTAISRAVSRRQLLALPPFFLAALFLPGRVLAERIVSQRFSDAHVHLFNVADLPARGFLRHVLAGENADRGPFPALLDLVERLQAYVVSASQELDDHVHGRPRKVVTARELYDLALGLIYEGAERSAIRVPSLTRLLKLYPLRLQLADSYGLILATLAHLGAVARRLDRSLEQLLGVPPVGAEDVLLGGFGTPIESRLANRVLRLIGRAFGAQQCPEAPSDSSELSLAGLRARLLWLHLIVQPRRFLLERYLATIGREGQHPQIVVNLLVDFDRWVADWPKPSSNHHAQIAFWTKLSRDRRAQGPDIRTFAGFDPLRHAEERQDGSTRYLDTLIGFYHARHDPGADRAIHGLKLYPPMGFAPSGNRPSMFEGAEPVLAPVRARWAARFPDAHLHEALDASLHDFFRRCAAAGIPILTHGYHSNEAGLCFGSRASPLGWRSVVKAHEGLRLCLAHFAEATDFVEAMNLEPDEWVHPRNWPLLGTGPLMRDNKEGGTQVFADLGYMSELLVERNGIGRERARRFFQGLKIFCGRFDPECKYLLFGSDWLFLAQEPGHENYLQVIRTAMAEAEWEPDWQENLLWRNLERFVGIERSRVATARSS